LKRYKAERDEIKAKMVQAIEVAVTQTKESVQEKLDASSNEIDGLQEQIEELKKKVDDKTRTENRLALLKEQFDKEREELLASHRKEKEEYEFQIQLAQSTSQEESERSIKKQSEYDDLHKQMQQMQELHDEEVELVQREAREEARAEVEKEIGSLKSQLISVQFERDELVKQISELEKIMRETKAAKELEKAESDRSLNEMKAAHRKEIDELTAELDLFEAENVENMRKLRDSLKEKETVISAMGKQLADAEDWSTKANENEKALRSKIEMLEQDVSKLKSQLQVAEEELADQIVLKEKSIEDVANELTMKAQKQFKERNELYRGLKKKFDEATSKVSILDRDLRFAKKELDEAKKRHEAREADLKDELAQSKASVVKSEANTARIEKKHRLELQKCKEELEAANAISQQIQRSLAIVVNEKEKLSAEVVDLKNISEELMAMVEEKGSA
jgi:chromosome segregation ATPase